MSKAIQKVDSRAVKTPKPYCFTEKTLYLEWLDLSKKCDHVIRDMGRFCGIKDGKCNEYHCPRLRENPVSVKIDWRVSKRTVKNWLSVIPDCDFQDIKRIEFVKSWYGQGSNLEGIIRIQSGYLKMGKVQRNLYYLIAYSVPEGGTEEFAENYAERKMRECKAKQTPSKRIREKVEA